MSPACRRRLRKSTFSGKFSLLTFTFSVNLLLVARYGRKPQISETANHVNRKGKTTDPLPQSSACQGMVAPERCAASWCSLDPFASCPHWKPCERIPFAEDRKPAKETGHKIMKHNPLALCLERAFRRAISRTEDLTPTDEAVRHLKDNGWHNLRQAFDATGLRSFRYFKDALSGKRPNQVILLKILSLPSNPNRNP